MSEGKKKGAKLTEKGQIVLSYWLFVLLWYSMHLLSFCLKESPPLLYNYVGKLNCSLATGVIFDMNMITQGLREPCRVQAGLQREEGGGSTSEIKVVLEQMPTRMLSASRDLFF